MTHDQIKTVMARHLNLTAAGMDPGESPTDAFLAARAHLFTDVDGCTRAEAWLLRHGPAEKMNRRNTSYAFKHWAEAAAEGYVSNGALIAAALHLGFRHECINGSLNVHLNVDTSVDQWHAQPGLTATRTLSRPNRVMRSRRTGRGRS